MTDPIAVSNILALKKKSYDIKFDLEGTNYEAVENIGTGAYGVVCSAINRKSDEKVAIKKIPGIFQHVKLAKRTYREIKILKHFKHDNIIAIREILQPSDPGGKFCDIYMVLDLMESDLHRIIHSKQDLTNEHVRFFLFQILRGLKYIHSANVIHRDLKPANLLVNENCDLKIGDFGMSRGISSVHVETNLMMTMYVATRWYRAPELMILPKETYSTAIDMWSVGCIFAEMLGRKQIFPGSHTADQVEIIMRQLGTPSQKLLNLISSDYIRNFVEKYGSLKPIPLETKYPAANKKALNLLKKMLVIAPMDRITVEQALRHPYLSKYHDPDDEPICLPAFNFDFENEDMDIVSLKDVIMEEIMEYHEPRRPRLTHFDLKPAPKGPTGTKSPPIYDPKIMTGLQAFLDHKRQQLSKQTESSGNNLEGKLQFLHAQQKTNNSSMDQCVPAFESDDTHKPRTFTEQVFKKPEGVPLTVRANLKDGKDAITKVSSSDVEMLSARSSAGVGDVRGTLTVAAAAAGHDEQDIMMLSAKSETPSGDMKSEAQILEQADLVTKIESVDLCAAVKDETQKPMDAKERIRMALLNSDRKKKREEMAAHPRPITAEQRRKEREDKRNKKMKKMVEKKKKDKRKSTKEAVLLSEDDKSLLARWQNMQVGTKSSAPDITDHLSSAVESATLPWKPSVSAMIESRNMIPTTQIDYSSLGGQMTDLRPESGNGLYPQPATAPPVEPPIATGAETMPTDSPLGKVSVVPSLLPSHVTAPGEVMLAQGHVSQVVTPAQGHVSQVVTPAGAGYNPGLPTINQDIHLISTKPISVEQIGANSFTQKQWPQHGTEATVGGESMSLPSRLPTYTEAVQGSALLGNQDSLPYAVMPGHIGAYSVDVSPTLTDTNTPVPFAAYDPSSSTDESSVLSVSTSGEADGLTVLTRSLKQQHMDDLHLAQTPKGTGGGYGVGLDLDIDAFLENASSTAATGVTKGEGERQESAPLSASLLADWLEMTGNLDTHDLEHDLQQAFELSSPLSLSDLHMVS